MSDLKKQHIISKTYLKHFSMDCDGKNIFVIDRENPYRKGIQCKNSGDSIFWEKNYSDSDDFADDKFIEKMFGQEVEPNYNNIISEIACEHPKISFENKQKLIQWIFFNKMRSPIWEPLGFSESKTSRYNQKLHLDNFTNEDHFRATLNVFVNDVCHKRWTIYKNPEYTFWWTSDNPGFCIDLEKYEAGERVLPDPFYDILKSSSILFYPLSKNYCLVIHAYKPGEDPNSNFLNTYITFKQADLDFCKQINHQTLITQARLIISADRDSLGGVEAINLIQA